MKTSIPVTAEETVKQIMDIQKKKDAKAEKRMFMDLENYYIEAKRRSAKRGGYFI